LILSDVVGDPLSVIAGGPTAGDSSDAQDAMDVLCDERFSIKDKVPQAVWDYLQSSNCPVVGPSDERLQRTCNEIVSSNAIALRAASRCAEDLGYRVVTLSSRIEGESQQVAKVLCAIAKDAHEFATATGAEKPVCLLAGGESTVTLTGSAPGSKGGRNQEMALAAALELIGWENIVFLSGGSDGGDGPDCEAAGALATSSLCSSRQDLREAKHYLQRHDSYHFFQSNSFRQEHHIITGATGTNVMDVVVILVHRY
jgi:hydroxypyruvate reductase